MSKLRIFSSGLQSAAIMNVRQKAVRFLTNTNCLNHDFIKINRIYKIKNYLDNLINLVKIPVQTIPKIPILTIILTFLILPFTAIAQEEGKFHVGVNIEPYTNRNRFIFNGQFGYNLQDNMNVGIRYGYAKLGIRDFDVKGGTYFDANIKPNNLERRENRYNNWQICDNYLGTFTYYFNSGKSSFAPFVGGGIGIYKIRNTGDYYYDEYNYSEYINPYHYSYHYSYDYRIPSEIDKFGGLLTAGFESGKFRMALEYNLVPRFKGTNTGTGTGRISPNYYSSSQYIETAYTYNYTHSIRNSYFTATAGFYIGGGKWKLANRKTGYIDNTDNLIIPAKYKYKVEFSENMAALKVGNKWGFIDETSKEVIPFKYVNAGMFSEGLAPVKAKVMVGGYTSYNWDFIDKTGKEIIPLKYDDAEEFYEGLAKVKLNGKWGYIDKTGKEIIFCKYDKIGDFSEELIMIKYNGKWGYIDKNGKEVVPCKYELIKVFTDGLAQAKLNGKWGYIDKNGKEVVPCKYELIKVFTDGLAQVKLNGKWGFIDKTGTEIMPFVYNAVENFSEGLARAEYKGKWGFIDKRGREVIPFKYKVVEDFSNGLAFVKNKKGWGVIDKNGVIVVPLAYSKDDAARAERTERAERTKITERTETVKTTEVPTTQGNQNISVENLNESKSEVAVNIPTTNIKNYKTYAVIIANEHYRHETNVEFAKNDGETFKEYCVKTLGLPEKSNVEYMADATLNEIRNKIDWLSEVAEAFNGDINIIFYYAGHGIPDENSKTSYLLPVDGRGSNIKTCYKLDELYSELGALPAKSITIFMDACFSGAQRSTGGGMLSDTRGIAIKVKQGMPTGNMVVFSAAQGDETAYPYREKQHGMFTYFLLKKLQETKGDVTLGELGTYIETNVRQQSITVNKKRQTPTITPSSTMEDKWREMKLK